jgi:hypothetical protein
MSNQTNATREWVNGELDIFTFTVELIEALSVDFYAPANIKINSVNVISGTGTITLQVNNASYTLTNSITQGSKITVTTTTLGVVNLIGIYE